MAQGIIRVRCKECRKAGVKDSYCIKKAKEVRCTHHDIVFQALYRGPDGKQIASPCKEYGRSLGDAQAWLAKIATEINQGTYQSIEPKKLKEVADDYLLPHRGNIRPGVYSVYEYHVGWIKKEFGEYPIHKITHKMLSDFMAKYLHDSVSQRQKIQARLKGIFRLAELEGYIKKNPAKYLQQIRSIEVPKPGLVLPPYRIHELLEALEAPWVKLYHQIAFFTGLRPNEICGLRKDAINLDKRELRVSQVCYYFKTKKERGASKLPYGIYPCKSPAAYRVLPIGKELIEPLQTHLINSPETPHNLLFISPNSLMPLHHDHHVIKDNYNPTIKTLNRRTEFPIMEFYDSTRHTYASILFEMGINLKKAQYLMGHEEFETTANLYARIFGKNISEDNEFRKVADSMESFVRSSVSLSCH